MVKFGYDILISALLWLPKRTSLAKCTTLG